MFPTNLLFLLLASLALLHLASAVPVPSLSTVEIVSPSTAVYDPEEAAGLPEGDMLLTPEQLALLTSPIMGRNGLIAETKRWPNREVRYRIIGDFDATQRSSILSAIFTIASRTCLKFVEAEPTETRYVAIGSKAGGCYSAVGYQAKVQEMNLEPYPQGEGCFRFGSILHELMHVLGFYHEQSASDRDDFVDVVYDNIVPGKEFNFAKYAATVVTDFGVGYDYESCLHYRAGAFSANGQDTIVPFDRQAKIGQRTGLSRKDIDKINVMYKCPIKL